MPRFSHRRRRTGRRADKETLAMMGAGDVFGEIALLLDEPRAASVESVDQVTVLVIDKKTISEGFGIDSWTGSLVRALAQRFRRLDNKYAPQESRADEHRERT